MEIEYILVDLGEGKISSYCLKSPKELFVDEFIIEKNEGPRQILNWKHGMFAAVINEQQVPFLIGNWIKMGNLQNGYVL